MNPLRLLVLLLAVVSASPVVPCAGDDDPPRPEPTPRERRERLAEIYRGEAAGYTLYRDAGRTEKVELRPDPVYVWTNPLRSKGQDGAVFVWTCRGRAEVIGTFFSSPATGPRALHHEFHSLATTVLDVSREGDEHEHEWRPTAPGITPSPITGAPAPAASAPRRLAQMHALTKDFSARSEDKKGETWELRLLPQPLYRYQSTDPAVLDGAVFAYVTSAGTDPEILLVLEARRTGSADGTGHSWHYALARFSDLNLWVRHGGKEVFTATAIDWKAPRQDPQDRYRCFRDREIPAVEEPAP